MRSDIARPGRSAGSPRRSIPAPVADRVARGAILGGAAFVLALLLWGHLGLGAWLFPPAANAARQTAHAGPYALTLALDGGQPISGAGNAASLLVRDAAGHPVDGATVRVQPVMTTMRMAVPPAAVSPLGGGRYLIRPAFSMAGRWRLDLTIAAPGQPERHASFDVGVRWK